MKHIAFPFHTFEDAHVEAAPWCLIEPDGNISGLGDHLAGWDYARELRISRRIGLAGGSIGDALGLPEDVELEVFVRIGTGPGSMPRRTWVLTGMPLRKGGLALVDHIVPGHELSQRLWLETTVRLPGQNVEGGRFSPWRAGSILWRDRFDVRLEGNSPRFPMEIVSFRERFAGRAESGGLWHLHWRPGHLHRDFGGSVRLFLNDDRKDFIERFVEADPMTLQCTLADVMSQILEHALREDDLEEILEECEPTSLAGHVETWLELVFPGQGVASIRNLLHVSPGHFRASVLAMADPSVLGGAT